MTLEFLASPRFWLSFLAGLLWTTMCGHFLGVLYSQGWKRQCKSWEGFADSLVQLNTLHVLRKREADKVLLVCAQSLKGLLDEDDLDQTTRDLAACAVKSMNAYTEGTDEYMDAISKAMPDFPGKQEPEPEPTTHEMTHHVVVRDDL